MIAYSLVGTDNLVRAAGFYDPIFEVLGAARSIQIPERLIAWGPPWTAPFFGVIRPYNNEPASVGNGTMVSLSVAKRSLIDSIHRIALANGGRDEGEPGIRGSNANGFYGAYFRDLDGNKICICRYGAPEA